METIMNAALKTQTLNESFQVEPVLRKVWIDAAREHEELQQMFKLMGWGKLPDRLKLAIKDDVSAMVEELKGNYSTCDPHVLHRRKSVTYWVNCYLDNVCSLKTAITSLSVNKI